MFLSVIIPNYNSGRLLANSLERLFQNPITYQMEVLVVDNCSEDGSTEVVARYSERHVRLVREADRGVYDAMNKGIQLARGEWLYFLGAGDLFFPEKIQTGDFQAGVEFVYGEVENNPSPLRGSVGLIHLLEHNLCHQGIFYRKSLFMRYRGYDLAYRIMADHVLNIRLFFDSSVKKYYLPTAVASYLGKGISHAHHDAFYRQNKRKVIVQSCLSHPNLFAWWSTGVYFSRILRRNLHFRIQKSLEQKRISV
jgi:glycosyltransferase involved in cell wall biosynthesis